MAEGVAYPTEDPNMAPAPVETEAGSGHMDPARLAQLEHELLDETPQEWADEAAASVTAFSLDPQA